MREGGGLAAQVREVVREGRESILMSRLPDDKVAVREMMCDPVEECVTMMAALGVPTPGAAGAKRDDTPTSPVCSTTTFDVGRVPELDARDEDAREVSCGTACVAARHGAKEGMPSDALPDAVAGEEAAREAGRPMLFMQEVNLRGGDVREEGRALGTRTDQEEALGGRPAAPSFVASAPDLMTEACGAAHGPPPDATATAQLECGTCEGGDVREGEEVEAPPEGRLPLAPDLTLLTRFGSRRSPGQRCLLPPTPVSFNTFSAVRANVRRQWGSRAGPGREGSWPASSLCFGRSRHTGATRWDSRGGPRVRSSGGGGAIGARVVCVLREARCRKTGCKTPFCFSGWRIFGPNGRTGAAPARQRGG